MTMSLILGLPAQAWSSFSSPPSSRRGHSSSKCRPGTAASCSASSIMRRRFCSRRRLSSRARNRTSALRALDRAERLAAAGDGVGDVHGEAVLPIFGPAGEDGETFGDQSGDDEDRLGDLAGHEFGVGELVGRAAVVAVAGGSGPSALRLRAASHAPDRRRRSRGSSQNLRDRARAPRLGGIRRSTATRACWCRGRASGCRGARRGGPGNAAARSRRSAAGGGRVDALASSSGVISCHAGRSAGCAGWRRAVAVVEVRPRQVEPVALAGQPQRDHAGARA